MSKTVLVLGAGFAGCTVAHLLAQQGWSVSVIEREHLPGGGCRTLWYGGHPYTNGPRLYYGYSEKIHAWVNRFIELRPLPLELWSYVESERIFFNYPIHENDIPLMSRADQIKDELEQTDRTKACPNFEEYWISRVGRTLYDMFINSYSKKMWGIESNIDLDTFSWSAKDNPINSGSKLAYKGSFMAYPLFGDAGYDPYFEKCLERCSLYNDHEIFGTDLSSKKVVVLDRRTATQKIFQADVIVSSIPIEELTGVVGGLPYMSRSFIPFVLPTRQVCPGDVRFLHYTSDEPYTRIVEYKKLTRHKANNTLLVMELPSKTGPKLYPMMQRKHIDKAKDMIRSLPKDVHTVGRLGTYKYSTIEQTIAQAFSVVKRITGKSVDGLEEEFFEIGDVSLFKERRG